MKNKVVILGALLFVLFLSSSCCFSDKDKYPYGIDTQVYIGDGRFQIFRIRHDSFYENQYAVVDPDTGENIEMDVSRYYDFKKSGKLYLIGSMGYTIIDYKDTKTYEQHDTIDEFNDEDQGIFKQESKFVTLGR